METEEAVKWIFDVWHEWENVYGYDAEQNLKEGKKLDEVIELLRRGEKFEEMWEEIRTYHLNDLDDDYLEEVEYKYFPKEGKTNETTIKKTQCK